VGHIEETFESLIHKHEENAEVFALLSYGLGIVFNTWFVEKSYAQLTTYLVIILSLEVLYFAGVTGATGGEIRHIEIRHIEIRSNELGIENNK
jgi:hypothetical protein